MAQDPLKSIPVSGLVITTRIFWSKKFYLFKLKNKLGHDLITYLIQHRSGTQVWDYERWVPAFLNQVPRDSFLPEALPDFLGFHLQIPVYTQHNFCNHRSSNIPLKMKDWYNLRYHIERLLNFNVTNQKIERLLSISTVPMLTRWVYFLISLIV